ncbi:MAG: hypothetical protein CME64_17295 [Halobacteriovoraceae bacterium]|nr:hypothetical protein [Halobacteriovoraceae bacterium]|tara:strand:+ start:284808 stop:286835 length:2028 start_codon:yes stop_codon:yes gene_type:complete
MGDVKQIFNILLLSISLATVLITLVSFIVFKFRYSYSKKDSSKLHQIKGSFFKRFAPHLEAENLKVLEESKAIERKRMSPQKKLVYTFASISFFIFSFLSAENYLSFRKEVSRNTKDAERVKNLVRSGLLQKKEFNPLKETSSFEEVLTKRQSSQYKNIINSLNKLKIVLITDRQNSVKNKPNYPVAFKRWRDFFQRNNIRYRVSGISGIGSEDFVVLPQLRYLSKNQKKQLKLRLGKNKMLFTGLPGMSNGKSVFLKELGVADFLKNPKKDVYLPTQLIGGRGIAAGKTLPWYPLDQEFMPNLSNVLSRFTRVSGHNGEPVDSLQIRDFFHPKFELSWSYLDPQAQSDYHSDYLILSLLARGAGLPFVEIANWKKVKNKAVFGMTVDSEDKFKNVEKFMKLFESEKLNATFFLVSDLMNENAAIDFGPSSYFEFATHTKDHLSMPQKSLKEQFFDLEESRFDIEERTGSRVYGLRPPKEEINETALSAVVQNEFSYLLGGNLQLSFSPEIIANGALVHIPRTLSDDFEFHQNKFIIKRDQMLQAMKRDLEWVKSANGAHFLSLHTQLAGKDFAFKTIEKFVKDLERKGLWIAQAKEVATWWKQKESLEVKVGSANIEVVNHGSERVENFDIIIHNASELSNLCLKRNLSNVNKNLVLNIENVSPGETLSLCSGN